MKWTYASRRLLGILAAASLLVASSGIVAEPGDASGTQASKVVLRGHVPLLVSSGRASRVGVPDPKEEVTLGFVVPLRNKQTLDRLIAGVSTPGSASYGKYLKPADFEARFGATDSQRTAIEGFLSSSGFREQKTYNNGLYILATGTLDQASNALGIEFATYRGAAGQTFRSPVTDPSIPANLQGILTHISGLDTMPAAKSLYKPRLRVASTGGYAPNQMWTAYNELPLAANGFSGSGETVASVQFGTYNLADVQQFESTFGLASATITSVPLGSGCSDIGPNNPETALDIEMQLAFAPGVQNVLVYETQNMAACEGALYQQIATDNLATAVSSSWTECEPDEPGGLDYDPSVNAALAQMAAQGQTFFAASGDDGAFGCYEDVGSPYQFSNAVTYPASDPNAVGVGGTSLTLSGSSAWSSETAWNYTACSTSCSSTGGGFSWIFPYPPWQTGPGVSTSPTSNREVPDVALDSDPNTGYAFVFDGAIVVGGGTSFAAPAWAGIAALYNQYADWYGIPRLGFANPNIYAVANSSFFPNSFHNITSGYNGLYYASTGYSPVTGWGTPNINNLVNAFATLGAQPPPPGTIPCSLTAQPPPATTSSAPKSVIFLPKLVDLGPLSCDQ